MYIRLTRFAFIIVGRPGRMFPVGRLRTISVLWSGKDAISAEVSEAPKASWARQPVGWNRVFVRVGKAQVVEALVLLGLWPSRNLW